MNRITLLVALTWSMNCSDYNLNDRKDGASVTGSTSVPTTQTGTVTGTTPNTTDDTGWIWIPPVLVPPGGGTTGGTASGGGTTGGTSGSSTGGTTGAGTGGATTGGPTGSTTGTSWTFPDTGTWDTGNWGLCDWASHVAGFLDAYQTPNDGKVIFCHSSSGTNYVLNDTDISSCLTHINHNYDVMPTTICDS